MAAAHTVLCKCRGNDCGLRLLRGLRLWGRRRGLRRLRGMRPRLNSNGEKRECHSLGSRLGDSGWSGQAVETQSLTPPALPDTRDKVVTSIFGRLAANTDAHRWRHKPAAESGGGDSAVVLGGGDVDSWSRAWVSVGCGGGGATLAAWWTRRGRGAEGSRERARLRRRRGRRADALVSDKKRIP